MNNVPNNEIPLDPPCQANDGSEGNTFRLTEADMQRVIGQLQESKVYLAQRGELAASNRCLSTINWLDSIQPEHTIDPDGDLSEVDLD